jgi:hypothetical protein
MGRARMPINGPIPTPLMAYSLRRDNPIRIADYRFAYWSQNKNLFYVEQGGMGATGSDKTYVLSTSGGHTLPDLPESGLRWNESGPGLVKVIEAHGREIGSSALKAFAGGVYPGRDLPLHAFIRRNSQPNLYRIPLP